MTNTKESGMGGQFMTEPHDHGDRFSDACLICVRAERDALRKALTKIEALRTNEHAAGFDEAREIAAAALERPDA